MIDYLAKIVTAGNLVSNFSEDLTDLVFDRVRPGRSLHKAVKVWEKLLVDKVAEIVAGRRRAASKQ